MNEKFYYSKRFLRGMLVLGIGSMFICITTVVLVSIKDLPFISTENLLYSLQFICFAIVAAGSFRILFKVKSKPAITITDNKIVFGPYIVKRFFGDGRKLELNFGQIISAVVIDNWNIFVRPLFGKRKDIEVKFKIDDDKVRSFHIYLSVVDNPERLIEILKQHIKFV
ncbi:MAG TPA: hypothetical protein VGB16_05605 [candidate division Zixibacteria bacterium]